MNSPPTEESSKMTPNTIQRATSVIELNYQVVKLSHICPAKIESKLCDLPPDEKALCTFMDPLCIALPSSCAYRPARPLQGVSHEQSYGT